MTGFSLDTSGAVELPLRTEDGDLLARHFWSDLSPFEQGYVEALFASFQTRARPERGDALSSENLEQLQEGDVLQHVSEGQFVFSGRVKLSTSSARLEVRVLGAPSSGWRLISFSAFSFHSRPSEQSLAFSSLSPEALEATRRDCAAVEACYAEHHGPDFWTERQQGDHRPDFPPLTASLGDDGNIHLTEARSKPEEG